MCIRDRVWFPSGAVEFASESVDPFGAVEFASESVDPFGAVEFASESVDPFEQPRMARREALRKILKTNGRRLGCIPTKIP